MMDSILAVITNYGFSDNSDKLKVLLSPYFETILVDSSSPSPPKYADYIIPNDYYGGLWNKAVRLAIEKEKKWLLFIASDVQISDVVLLAKCIEDMLKNSKRIGIYTPSLRYDSRIAFDYCYNRGTERVRECYLCEGFFFLARTEILSKIYPIDMDRNYYGWGIDIMASFYAYQLRLKVVVDDQVEIYHPPSSHPIPIERAHEQSIKYLDTTKAINFLTRVQERIQFEKKMSRVRKRLINIVRWLQKKELVDIV